MHRPSAPARLPRASLVLASVALPVVAVVIATAAVAVASPAAPSAPLAASLADAAPHRLYLPLGLHAAAPSFGAPSAPSANWCDRIASGPPGVRDIALDLSAAHAVVRQFSMASIYRPGDAALAAALALTDALKTNGIADALDVYDAALSDVCVLPAADAATASPALAAARVDVVDGVAFVVPGTGDVAIPPGATSIVLDLRGLPAVDGLDEAIGRAAAAAFVGPIELPSQRLRRHVGPTDEMFSATNVYTSSVVLDRAAPVTGTAAVDRPVAVLTGVGLAPAAARWAGALRMAGRARIIGEGVVAEVAEAEWRGVGAYGIAVRTRVLGRVFRRQPPEVLSGQHVGQDDPDDLASAGWKRDFTLPSDLPSVLTVTVDGQDGTDLDLVVLRDADGDGAFTYPAEAVASSAGATADEQAMIVDAPGGRYQVWVMGYDVPGGSTSFDATIDIEAILTWPDVIRADRHLATIDTESSAAIAGVVKGMRGPVPAAIGSIARSMPVTFHPYQKRHPAASGRGEVRAALLIAHGMTRLYWRYFDVVGDHIDERLAETLATLDAMPTVERPAAARLLRRFGEVLHDGHQFNYDYGSPPPAGYLPVFIDRIDGLPVVRRSNIDAIRAGDTILSVDGRTTADWYAEEMSRTSAATPGYLFDMASRFFVRMDVTRTFVVRDPDGIERSAVVAPQPAESINAVSWPPSVRPSGLLANAGAPSLYYFNMDGSVTIGIVAARAAISEAVTSGATGMVLDMRGYPTNINHYEVASRLIQVPFKSPQFVYTVYTGPDHTEVTTSQSDRAPLTAPAFTGPIVLITGEHAVSAAENFMLMLEGAHRLTAIVGQPSAGTNGNITGVQLPGAFAFGYTGMGLLRPDGSRFHGIGIRPTLPVPLSAADFRDGIDRELATAIEILNPTPRPLVRNR